MWTTIIHEAVTGNLAPKRVLNKFTPKYIHQFLFYLLVPSFSHLKNCR